ncbi:nucleotide-diphospho-sugar transferase [Armillaria novae-zelandiae]|uniref:Nucleotide-diphospho-sugar transferase n=1 Tax=Armillaria novae-zelandiae TaxID=153914 RepID=A0AA39P5T6_9AGAR|nr:nucleotide-diphospho-sugar transferase [Armillaria novae-zelandiae]
MPRRSVLCILLSLLGLFLVGTVVVLSSISSYLAIDPDAYLIEHNVPTFDRWNATEHGRVERVPRLFHQTAKTDILSERWRSVSQQCRDLMPDYEYILWTDKSSREFISEHYPWFLRTYDGYRFPIQRADVIRYFVLHHYGGIYYDVDIGCKRPLDPLLTYPVILPKTIPVGLIHNLATFDHSWFLNYPTVMFSTGPMFLSIQYAIWTSSHAAALSDPIRILPKSLYGKNAKDGEAPHSFFSHFYGSSWHADDAAFIGFLGHWGNKLMLAGVVVLIAGLVMRLMGGLSSRWAHDSPSSGDRTNDGQRGVLFFLPVSIQPHDVELNASLEEMRLEKRRHVQEPGDGGPGEYCGTLQIDLCLEAADSNRYDLEHFCWRTTKFQLEDDEQTLIGSPLTVPIRRHRRAHTWNRTFAESG